jgi:hypothetical protein
VKLSNNMIISLWYQTCDYKTCFSTEACILTGTGSIEICYALSACSPPCKAKPKSVTFGGARENKNLKIRACIDHTDADYQ